VTTEDPAAPEHFRALPQVESVTMLTPAIRISGSGDHLVTHVIHSLAEHRIRVVDFRVERPTLEDVFLRVTGHGLRD
jgi:hypothetical protein